MSITQLPEEVLKAIFSFVDPTTLGRLASVCKDFRRLSYDNSLWRHHIECEFGSKVLIFDNDKINYRQAYISCAVPSPFGNQATHDVFQKACRASRSVWVEFVLPINDDYIASAGGNVIEMWNWRSNQLYSVDCCARCACLAYVPEDKTLGTKPLLLAGFADGTVGAYDIPTLKTRFKTRIGGGRLGGNITSIHPSRHSSLLGVVVSNGSVAAYDLVKRRTRLIVPSRHENRDIIFIASATLPSRKTDTDRIFLVYEALGEFHTILYAAPVTVAHDDNNKRRRPAFATAKVPSSHIRMQVLYETDTSIYFATGGRDSMKIQIWRWSNTGKSGKLRLEMVNNIVSGHNAITSMTLPTIIPMYFTAPNEIIFSSSDTTLKVANLRTGAITRNIHTENEPIQCVACWGETIIIGAYGTVTVFELSKRQL